jgi:IMP dehydrogenase/GMP reductase
MVVFVGTVAVPGKTATETLTADAVIVIVAAAAFVPSATDVAVRVTEAGVGTVAGAV